VRDPGPGDDSATKITKTEATRITKIEATKITKITSIYVLRAFVAETVVGLVA
jgi:hypothetical protein